MSLHATAIAIDIGTSSVKTMRLTSDSSISEARTHPYLASKGGQEPGTISIDSLRATVDRAIEAERGARNEVELIAVTGQMHGTVLISGEKDALAGTPILWTDTRTAPTIRQIRERLGPDLTTRIGGTLMPGFQAATLAWLLADERWVQVEAHEDIRVLSVKDSIVHHLTGATVTDPTDAAGTGLYNIGAGTWDRGILDALRIPLEWMPRVVPTGTVLNPPETVPMLVAGGDAAVAAYGADVRTPHTALLMLSTGAQILMPAEKYTPDPAGRWYTWPAVVMDPERDTPFLRAGTTLSAGLALRWAGEVLFGDQEAFYAAALDSPAGANGLLFLPHLIGERTPTMNADARAAFVGLGVEHRASDLARAVLEGVLFACRDVLTTMTEGSALPRRVVLGGGGAKSDFWRQMATDILGIPTIRGAPADLSCYGAATMARMHLDRTGQRVWTSPNDDQGSSVNQYGRALEPDRALAATYDMLFDIYRDTVEALEPIHQQLAAFRT